MKALSNNPGQRLSIQVTKSQKQQQSLKDVLLDPNGPHLGSPLASSARHSFATDMLDQTGNIVLVGRLLGHRSVTSTQRYLHPEMKGLGL
jgi:site-specific recombinase XerC